MNRRRIQVLAGQLIPAFKNLDLMSGVTSAKRMPSKRFAYIAGKFICSLLLWNIIINSIFSSKLFKTPQGSTTALRKHLNSQHVDKYKPSETNLDPKIFEFFPHADAEEVTNLLVCFIDCEFKIILF